MSQTSFRSFLLVGVMAGVMAGLAACGSTNEKPKPKDLAPNVALIGVKQAWSAKIGEVSFPLTGAVGHGNVVVASSSGDVVNVDARSGTPLWRLSVGEALSAGVGSDGKVSAVVTKGNFLVVLDASKELWRQKLPAQGFTAPLVAGGRVFLLTADRLVSAFDAKTGQKLWSQQRPSEPLILRQPGALLAVGDTLVVGQSGRLVGFNPTSGVVRWESPIASSRGTNDVERLIDLVGGVSRSGDVVCARAFQTGVGCVNALRGNVLWTAPASGYEGLHGDADRIFGVESDGKVVAWQRADGKRLWTTDRLQFRTLTTPLVLGRSVVFGDTNGNLHFLSREDGTPLSRVTTDGTGIVGAPLLVDGTLVAVTRSGNVFGFVPE